MLNRIFSRSGILVRISYIVSAILFCLILLPGCGSPSKKIITFATYRPVAVVLKQESPIWDIKDGKAIWKASLTIGEQVYVTGSTKKAIQGTEGEREYVLIMLSDKTEGWIRPIFLAVNAIAGVVTGKKTVLYTKPHNLRAGTRVLANKQIVGVFKNGTTDLFLRIAAYDPHKHDFVSDVYVRKDEVSTVEADVQSAIILQLALLSKNNDQKNALLSSALKDYPGNRFAAEIKALQAITPTATASDVVTESYSLKTTINESNVNLRRKPNLSGDLIGQLNKNDQVTITERTIDPVTIEGKSARWYHLDWPTNGWVFGAFIQGVQ